MKTPEYPTINLTIRIFYLAQFAIVGDNYTGPALLVDDLLTRDAFRQFLRRGMQYRAAQRQDGERQDHPVYDFAPPRALRRACLEHTAMVMMIYRPLVNLRNAADQVESCSRRDFTAALDRAGGGRAALYRKRRHRLRLRGLRVRHCREHRFGAAHRLDRDRMPLLRRRQ
jgi:hypothetical protein